MDIIRAFILAFFWLLISIGITYLFGWRIHQDYSIYNNPVLSSARVEEFDGQRRSRRSGTRYNYTIKIDNVLVSHFENRPLDIGSRFPVVYSAGDPSHFVVMDHIPNSLEVIGRYLGGEPKRTGYAIFVPISWLVSIWLTRRCYILYQVPDSDD